MSNKLTYIEARDKIWNAYFRDEIKPFDVDFCFCGTLAGNSSWRYIGKELPYEHAEFGMMEKALFSPFPNIIWISNGGLSSECSDDDMCDVIEREDFEDSLFAGMLAALEVLKQIHRDRGDFIPEDEPLLTKRKILTNQSP